MTARIPPTLRAAIKKRAKRIAQLEKEQARDMARLVKFFAEFKVSDCVHDDKGRRFIITRVWCGCGMRTALRLAITVVA